MPASLSVSKRKNFLEEWLSKGLERVKEYGRIEGREIASSKNGDRERESRKGLKTKMKSQREAKFSAFLNPRVR